MFNASPTPDFLRRYGIASQVPPPQTMDAGMGGMPISIPSPMTMNAGGYQPMPMNPSMNFMGARGLQERANSGVMGGQVKKNMRQPVQNKMAQNRPGFWGKYNTIAQGLQPMAMDALMRG